ncbi:MAG: patatin-like phospholipase family protein [Thermodesulfobacteriota bacterium]
MAKLIKVGLALGGGGARGLAHIGVLQALEEEKIPIDLITGTSMGALVAGVYALYPQSQTVIKKFQDYLSSKTFQKTNPEFLHDHGDKEFSKFEGIFQRFSRFIKKGVFYSQSLAKKSAISEEIFQQNIEFLLDDVEIQDTAIPLAVVALDLKSGEEAVIKRGSLRKAISASCAIPGILPPVKFQGKELIDGGWIDKVPIHPLREMGADVIIAVDVAEGLDDVEDLSTGLGIFLRSYEISRYALSTWQLKEADVVISPDVSNIHWADFGHFDHCLQAGISATKQKMPVIKKLIRHKKIKKILRWPFFG